jgi:sugar phosphate isomerase/epimerase
MLNRRHFLALGASALPLMSSTALSAAVRQTPVGLQLSTVGAMAKTDLPGTLKAVHQIGFEEVELYNVGYDLPAATLRSMVTDAGLLPPASAHMEYAELPAKLEYAKALGVRYVICPMLPKSQWMTPEGYHEAAKALNDWGRRAADLGLQFGFHNHDYEFRPLGDTTGFDILMKETDPKLVCLEMDCYWITQSGHDPVEMMQKLGRRVRLIHLKDRKPGFPTSYDMTEPSAHFTEVGTGSIDWKTVIAEARRIGVEHFYVEHDRIGPQPLASLAISYRNARALLNA